MIVDAQKDAGVKKIIERNHYGISNPEDREDKMFVKPLFQKWAFIQKPLYLEEFTL